LYLREPYPNGCFEREISYKRADKTHHRFMQRASGIMSFVAAGHIIA